MIQRGPLSTFLRISREKKILIFKIVNRFLIVYLIKSRKSLLSLEFLEKNYILDPLFEGKMIQKRDLYLLFENFKRKKNINFQNIKLTFNSIFYKLSKEFTFDRISRNNYFLDPLSEGKMIQNRDLYLLFWQFQEKQKFNFQNIKLIFNSIFYNKSKEYTFARISRKK